MTPAFLLGAGGLRTSLGRSVADHAQALREPAPSLSSLPPPVCLALAQEQAILPYHLAAPLSGDVAQRYNSLVQSAVEDALSSAGLDKSARSRTGVYLGSSSGDIALLEDAYRRDLRSNDAAPPLDWRCSLEHITPRIRREFGLGCEGFAVSTACTASANAMLYAARAIASGRIEHALILGLEIFNETTALGFHSLELVTPTAMRPFSPDRNGLVLGEAVAALVLSGDDRCDAPERGRVTLLGGAIGTDTFGISAANPDGRSVADVIGRALRDGGVTANEVAAIKTHATASLLNDEAEALGLNQIFGDRMPTLTALKPYIGHTFGASGACEFLILAACLREGFWPGCAGFDTQHSDLGIRLPAAAATPASGPVLFNHFGFGGNNCCLVAAHG